MSCFFQGFCCLFFPLLLLLSCLVFVVVGVGVGSSVVFFSGLFAVVFSFAVFSFAAAAAVLFFLLRRRRGERLFPPAVGTLALL